jgi:hypothetical protein
MPRMPKGRALGDYFRVRHSYMVDDDVMSAGEVIHRKHPLFRAEFCEPVDVQRDVEDMTADPGEKRAI